MTAAPKLRSDAALRRETILHAAKLAFAEFGFDVPLEEICRTAGVGRATLYRNFANRLALVHAIMERNIDQLDAVAEAAGDDPNGIFLYCQEVLNQQVFTGGQVYLVRQDDALNERLLHRVNTALRHLLKTAKAAGKVRPEITTREMHAIFGMMWGGLENNPLADRKALAPFVLETCCAGLRPVA